MTDDLMQPDPGPQRADAVKNRERLLETAQRLFAEQDVETVTMTAVASAAGVGKGTLYRHFSDKAELCHALLDQEMHDLQERALRRIRNHPGTPEANLRWFVEQVMRFVYGNDALLCEASYHAGVSILQHPAHLWWRQTIHGLLRQLDPPGDLDYSADVLYVMLDVQTQRFQRHTLHYDLERILRGLMATVDRILT